MMRESTSPFTESRRSSRASPSMKSSSSGCTVYLGEQLTQTVTGAKHAHLQRRHPDARDLRHLLVAQVFDILHQKRFPLFRPQPLHGAIDFFTPRLSLRRMLLGRTEKGKI